MYHTTFFKPRFFFCIIKSSALISESWIEEFCFAITKDSYLSEKQGYVLVQQHKDRLILITNVLIHTLEKLRGIDVQFLWNWR